MKINDKYHWDGFIYGLIYPGFVGSMIYELIPATKADATADSFLLIQQQLKYLLQYSIAWTTFICIGTFIQKSRQIKGVGSIYFVMLVLLYFFSFHL